MSEKTCPPHDYSMRIILSVIEHPCIEISCELCGELLSPIQARIRLNEYETLKAAIDAFLSDATLLPVFSHGPGAWSSFITEWVKSFQVILSGGEDEKD